jgi:hypothetical protein
MSVQTSYLYSVFDFDNHHREIRDIDFFFFLKERDIDSGNK